MENNEYTVVDVETTGLFPEMHDRIIEIAAIRVDSNGNFLDEYVTLINPNRDVGPTHIHGITAKEVKNAPIFPEVAGDILSRIVGTVFTGHNVFFDFRFLQSEFIRLGCALPEIPLLCTIRLSREAAPDINNRKLATCCDYFGIPIEGAHRAYNDAKATAKLLSECLKIIKNQGVKSLSNIGVCVKPADSDYFPRLSQSGKSYTREHAFHARKTERSYIASLVSSLPSISSDGVKIESYMNLLDRVLEDRRITIDEAQNLLILAESIGMTREDALNAHYRYMNDLISVALADRIITENETRDIDEVRQLLSITDVEFQNILMQAQQRQEKGEIYRHAATCTENVIGKKICFTGEFRYQIHGKEVTRQMAVQIAQDKGMIVKNSVSRDLDFLVVADPDSMSGKAKKAREYNIRIISEPIFWRMFGVQIE